jgi:hypothetical protein
MPRNLLQVTIHLNDGREISTKFSHTTTEVWPWVVLAVATNMSCDEGDVDEIETDNGDRITVKGEIVGFYKMNLERPRLDQFLQAAE